MRKLILGLSLSTIFLANIFAQDSQNGEALFEEKGCTVCHKLDMDTVGPSIKNIAYVYAGKEMNMLTYLKGQGTPIVDPARAPVMNPQLIKLRTMFEEDLHAISTYILNSNR
ncbi:MAG: c-type cytochrome [Sulfurimonadaceae bacterium]|jgi:cytochrome c|nr:c-type cytochrome [Sulfurimonadaceae bacterium]